jgi:arsenate reductase
MAGGGDAAAVAIYGIKACDTMRKARTWLDEHGIGYVFHDYKTQGIDRGVLEGWAKAVGWEVLLNRSGTTFRKVPEADRQGLTEAKAIELMVAQPSMIKRPVLEVGDGLIVGFKPEVYAARFG